MNSILRTIELTTYMLAPVISGQLFYFIGYIWTGVFIAGWNIVSVVCEYGLLNGIYRQYPRLAQKITSTDKGDEQAVCEEGCRLTNDENEKRDKSLQPDANKKTTSIWEKIVPKAVTESFVGWQTYFDHPVRYVNQFFGAKYSSLDSRCFIRIIFMILWHIFYFSEMLGLV